MCKSIPCVCTHNDSDHNNYYCCTCTLLDTWNFILIVPTHFVEELKGLSCMRIIPIPLVAMETEAPALRLTLCDLVDFISKYAMFCRVY